MSASVTAPHVYRAIHAISAALSKVGIAKTHTNFQDQYSYRSIDDVLAKLAPLLVKNRLCILPRVLSRQTRDRRGEANTLLVSVELLVRYDLVSSRDGSRHTVKAFGEAVDPSDKATAKAMSAAYKSAMLQLFCIPVASADADSSSYRLRPEAIREPVEGWSCWADGICEMIGVCESNEALDVVRSRQAALLVALSRARPELYQVIGERFSARLNVLDARAGRKVTPGGKPSRTAANGRGKMPLPRLPEALAEPEQSLA